MAKDPAFLFYYQDFLVGTDDFTNEETGAYIRCLCMQAAKGGISEKHMINICKTHEVHNSIKEKFFFDDENKIYKNRRLTGEIEKRKNYSNSRRDNRLGKNKTNNISSSYDKHMENENIIVLIRELEDSNGTVFKEGEKEKFMFLIIEMATVFKEKNPDYYFEKETDYSACLKIAYRIADMKNIKHSDAVNDKKDLIIKSWEKIVDFLKTDGWLNQRSLTDISKTVEWQRMVQKMSIKKTNPKKDLNGMI